MKKNKDKILKKLLVILIILVAIVGVVFGVMYIAGAFISIANGASEFALNFLFISLAVFAGVGLLDGILLCGYLNLIQLEKLNAAIRDKKEESTSEIDLHKE